MSEKTYKVSILSKKPEFEDYVDIIPALYPDQSVKVTLREFKATILAHLGRIVK